MPSPSIIDTRRHQMFPTLALAEIERLRRFGVLRSYGRGEPLVSVGEVRVVALLAQILSRLEANDKKLDPVCAAAGLQINP